MLDLKILNATVVSDGASNRLDVGIEAGVIVDVEQPGTLGPARSEFDATGLHLLPGAIDVHFHCRAPSHPERGDFRSESAAAAAGGVTTIFEMPISDPACSTPQVLAMRRALGERDSFVNFALYSGAALGGPAEAAAMAEAGAIGFKLFTLAPAPGREREFAGLWANTEGDIYNALAAVASTGLPCVIHAENEPLIQHFAGRSDDSIPTRPPLVEAAAIAVVAVIAKDVGARIHIAHVSSAPALAAVRGGIAAGGAVTAETCPQYLVLNSETTRRFGGLAKIAPPLREASNSAALWEGLRDGTLSVVASDHSPFLAEEKAGVEYQRAPQGLPTVELLVPVLLDAAAHGLLSLELAVDLVTASPARLFGLYPRKGTVAAGADADLALVALNETFLPGEETLQTRAAGCGIVFDGIELGARVKATIVNGQIVFADGRLQGEPGGRFTFARNTRVPEPEPV